MVSESNHLYLLESDWNWFMISEIRNEKLLTFHDSLSQSASIFSWWTLFPDFQLAAKFRNSGQTCVCANRILVQDGGKVFRFIFA